MTGPRLVVVGSLNIDITVRVGRLPQAGESVLGHGVVRRPGGKGANQAAAAARLGAATSLVGHVGTDASGRLICDSLRDNAVDVAAVKPVSGSTGTALILIDAAGENMIAISPEANATLQPANLDALPALLRTADFLLVQLEIPLVTADAVVRCARAAGVPVLLNAAPLPEQVDGDVLALVSMADVTVVNETEGLALARETPSVLDLPDGAEELAATLHRDAGAAGGKMIVTRGARGAVLAEAGRTTAIAGFAVDAADAVGAGDAFCAEVAIALAAAPQDSVAAVERGCAAGALAVRAKSDYGSLPTRGEVDALIADSGRRPYADQPRRRTGRGA